MTADPFTLSFGIKAVQEYEHDGAVGLLLQGYATRFGEVDQSGEHMTAAALSDLEDTWAAEPAPLVLFEHGLSELGARRIGKAIEHRIDEQGLHVSVFVPKEPRWKDRAALGKFSQVYRALRDGLVRGFSVGGTYTRDAAGAIKRWSTLELSITARPCLPSATFTVGAKAIGEAYGALPPILDDDDDDAHDARGAEQPSTGGSVSFVNAPQPHSTTAPTLLPVAMPAGNVTVSAPVSAAQGGAWTLSYQAGGNVLHAGGKALTKAEPDGAHPSSHYLFVGDPQVVGTWKLRYKDADGNVSPRLLGACHAALTVGYRGQKVDLPDDEKQRCLAKLSRLYKQAGLAWPEGPRSGGKTAPCDQDVLPLLQHYARRNDRHALRTLFGALDVLDDFATGAKAGRTHSAATVAAVRKIADGLDAHVGMLRDHFGIEGPAQDDEQDQEDDGPLVG